MKKYPAIKIIEISLNKCYSLIEENKDIEIMEKLGQAGKEWIKLLGFPIWCQNNNSREDIFIIPKHIQKWFISCNYVKKAIDEIIFIPQAYDLSSLDEHYNKEERKKIYMLKKRIKDLEEKLKKYEEEEEDEEDEENYSDIDDENDEEDNDQKGDDEEDEDEDEKSKNNNSKDKDAKDDMDIED